MDDWPSDLYLNLVMTLNKLVSDIGEELVENTLHNYEIRKAVLPPNVFLDNFFDQREHALYIEIVASSTVALLSALRIISSGYRYIEKTQIHGGYWRYTIFVPPDIRSVVQFATVEVVRE